MPVALVLAALIASLAPLPPSAPRPDADQHRLWQLRSTASARRWLIVRVVEAAAGGDILHVDVVSRRPGAPGWQVTHLVPHLASTRAAVERSVVRPLGRGEVYPEAFDAAYARWRERRTHGPVPIGTTTVDACMDALTGRTAVPGRARRSPSAAGRRP